MLGSEEKQEWLPECETDTWKMVRTENLGSEMDFHECLRMLMVATFPHCSVTSWLPSTAPSSLYRPKLRHNPRCVDNLMHIAPDHDLRVAEHASISPQHHHHRRHQLLVMKIEESRMMLRADPSACKGRSGSHIITPSHHHHIPFPSICPTESAFSFPTTAITFPILFYVFLRTV